MPRNKVSIKVAKAYPDAIVPKYAHQLDAGFDLHAYIPLSRKDSRLNEGRVDITEDHHPITIEPGKRQLIGTGIRYQLPEGYEMQVRPRSGLALKKGISVLNSPGTVDGGFLDEVKVIVINHGDQPFVINHGDRIAQGVLAEVPEADFVLVDELDGYNRGGGFGHSGVSV